MTRAWLLSILSTSLQAVTINSKAGMYFWFKGKILPSPHPLFFFFFLFSLSERYCACFTKGSRKGIKSKKNQTKNHLLRASAITNGSRKEMKSKKNQTNKKCYTLPQGMYCNTTINLKTNILSDNPHTNVKRFQRIDFSSRKIHSGRWYWAQYESTDTAQEIRFPEG